MELGLSEGEEGSRNCQERSPFAMPVAAPEGLCREPENEEGPRSSLGNMAKTSAVHVTHICASSVPGPAQWPLPQAHAHSVPWQGQCHHHTQRLWLHRPHAWRTRSLPATSPSWLRAHCLMGGRAQNLSLCPAVPTGGQLAPEFPISLTLESTLPASLSPPYAQRLL